MNSFSQVIHQSLKDIYLTIDISTKCAFGVLVSKEGTILEKRTFSNQYNDSLSNRCILHVEELLKICSKNKYAPIAIGVSTKGTVKRGFVLVHKDDLKGINLKGLLEQKFQLSTEILNHFHSAALGSSHALQEGKDSSLAVIDVSKKVGYGVVQSGEVQKIYVIDSEVGGSRIIERLSDRKRMSISSIVGSKGIKIRAKDFFGKSQTIKELFVLAKSNKEAEKILVDAADAVSELVWDLQSNLYPKKIVTIIYSEEGCSYRDRLEFLKNVEIRVEKKYRTSINIGLVDICEVDAKLIGAAKIVMQSLKIPVKSSMFVITGVPGAGKSTFVSDRLIKTLRERGIKVGGIICRDIRESGKRTGFSMKLLSISESDRSIELARAGTLKGEEWIPFSYFSVNVKNINECAVHTLKKAKENADVIVIDEVASMQLLSKKFLEIVEEILLVNKPLILTVPLYHNKHEIIKQIKKMAFDSKSLFIINPKEKQKSQDDAYKFIMPILEKQFKRLQE